MPQRQDDKFVWNDEYPETITVRSFEQIGEYRVRMTFSNLETREIDLELHLHGPIFDPLRKNPELYDSIHLEGGTLAWDNGADIAPETLYEESRPIRRDSRQRKPKGANRASRRPEAKVQRAS